MAGSLFGAGIDPASHPEELVEVIVMLRRLRMTGAEITFGLAMALSTVSAVLLRVGLGKLSRLKPPEAPNRYERRHPRELIHVDVKKLGAITGVGHRITGERDTQRRPTAARDGGAPKGWGVRARLRRRRHPTGLRRSAVR